MATYLFDVILAVAEQLPGTFYSGIVDSGDSGKLLDANIGGIDDLYNKGTVLITAADGTYPEKQSRIISDYTQTSGSVAFESVLSAAVAAGDVFGLVKPRYKRPLIVQYINRALKSIKLPTYNQSTTTDGDTKTYDLPTGINETTLLQVWMAHSSSAPYNWKPLYYYEIEYDGTDHVFRLKEYPTDSRLIRFVYFEYPSEVYDDDDEIDPRVNLEMLAAMALRRTLQWRYEKFSVPPERITNALNAALRREREMMDMHMPRLPHKFPRLPWTQIYSPGAYAGVPVD